MARENKRIHFWRGQYSTWTTLVWWMFSLVSVALAVLVTQLSRSGRLGYVINHPFSSGDSALWWVVLLVWGFLGNVLALLSFKRAKAHTLDRWFALTLGLVQAVSFIFLVVSAIVSVLQHNYAAAAAFSTAGALLFTALKLIGGGALGAAGAKLFNVTWDRVFKPKAKPDQSDA